MTTDLDIFLNAPDDLAPENLPAYLDHACGNDEELRKKAEALFAEDRLESGIVDQLPNPSGGPREDLEAEGSIIHNYKLLQKIGEGGFGDIYMAEQFKPVKRRVALKIIKLGMDTKQVVARFEAERQALALMDHPNIAKVHDGGSTELGRPYFVMELVRGIPITKFCDQQNLDTKERLSLFIDVCHAVQHAHQKGVIHRDLKPSNVMVTMHDDRAVVKVIDFGVAKATQTDLTDKTLFTKFDQFIGTPAYMSPEQALFSGLDIDTRSDIYTLGVLLYEILTGSTPFDSKEMLAAGYDEIRRIIKEDEPELPSSRLSTFGKAELTSLAKHRRTAPTRLHSLVKGDLDWIVMKAIEKDRTRRYDTANALAADIGRHLDDEPVVAAAPSTLYRLRKFAQRKKGMFASAAAITALLIAGTIVSTVLALRAKTAEQTAEQALTDKGEALIKAEEALDLSYVAVTRAAHRNLQLGEIGQAWSDLNLFRPAEGERDRRGWEWYYVASLTDQFIEAVPAGQGVLHAVSYSPLGKRIASAGTTGTVKIWDAKTRTQIDLLDEHKAAVLALSWQPGENSFLASASEDHTALIWDVNVGRVKTRLTGHLDRVQSVAWHPTGSIVATGGADGRILIWNPESGNKLNELNPDLPVLSLAWTPDGAHLIAGLDDANDKGRVMAWKAGQSFHFSKGPKIKVMGQGDGNSVVACMPGASLFAVGSDQRFSIYDFKGNANLAGLATLAGLSSTHGDSINSIAWHPRGTLAATASYDGLIKTWSWTDPENTKPATLRHRRDLPGHRGAVRSVYWSPDGERLISGGEDGMICFWNPERQAEGLPFYEPGNWISQVTWSPDGEKVAVANWTDEVAILDSATGLLLGKLEGLHTSKVIRVSWSPTGDRLATTSYDKTVAIWDAKTLTVKASLEHPEKMESALWSPDGKWLACGTWYWNYREGDVHDKFTMWDLSGGEPRRAFVFGARQGDPEGTYEKISRFAWHPGGGLIATAGRLGGIKLWNPKGELIRVVKAAAPKSSHHRNQPTDLAWNGEGDRLAVALDRGVLVLYAKEPGNNELHLLYEEESRTGSNITRLAWSPDSSRIALSRHGGLITLHDAPTGRFLMKLDHTAAARQSTKDADQNIFALDWSPDGTKIASGGADGVVRVWSAEKGYEMEAGE